MGLLTQVFVDEDDPAFGSPSKPIGPFHTRSQADELKRNGFAVREDAGRGFRREGIIRHPMPYGNLKRRRVEYFARQADLDRYECTIEEREEYKPYPEMGLSVSEASVTT